MLWTESSNVCYPDQYYNYPQTFYVLDGMIKLTFTYTNNIHILNQGELFHIPATTPFAFITGPNGATFKIEV